MKFQSRSTLPTVLEYYLTISFWTSAFLFGASHYIFKVPMNQQFFMISLVAMNYYFYFQSAGKPAAVYRDQMIPVYFLAQIICLIGTSFINDSTGALYLSLIPCAAGTYFFLMRDYSPQVNNLYRGINLFFIGASSYVFFSLYFKKSSLSWEDMVYFSGFLFWTCGVVYYGVKVTFKENKYLLMKLLRKSKKVTHIESRENRQKYFFHDLINITHGLNLFLEHNIKNGTELSLNETENIKNEIKLLESMIQDHFNYKHKNLLDHEQIVPFDQCKGNLYHIIKSYLPSDVVDCHFIFNGYLADSSSRYEKSLALIHLASFTRIMVNLVKNMSEVKTKQAEFSFDYDEKGLHIVTKNKIYQLKDERQNLASKMRELILKENVPTDEQFEGLGLLSTQSQVKSLGGEINIKIDDGYWITEILLPPINGDKIPTNMAA